MMILGSGLLFTKSLLPMHQNLFVLCVCF